MSRQPSVLSSALCRIRTCLTGYPQRNWNRINPENHWHPLPHPDEAVVVAPMSSPPDDYNACQELLGRMAVALDIHPEEGQEKSHRLVDILTSAVQLRSG
ncbi:hypothetical protein KIL84_014414 [Mauremys mutica]|uniref:Uncharacterized protein n=1 Tax=Mauremys mutica TaxID=74926 RepID=A0A9D3XPP0_9SAUR|nr:hypothetical protein KIL84_014414 [Mauremys mutica]